MTSSAGSNLKRSTACAHDNNARARTHTHTHARVLCSKCFMVLVFGISEHERMLRVHLARGSPSSPILLLQHSSSQLGGSLKFELREIARAFCFFTFYPSGQKDVNFQFLFLGRIRTLVHAFVRCLCSRDCAAEQFSKLLSLLKPVRSCKPSNKP